MKKHILIKGVLGVLLAGGLASCSSDYLDVAPETSFDASVVSGTVKGARLGIYGLCASMYCQYSNYQNQYSFNGETQTMMIYGDIMGQDYFSWIWAGRTSTWALNWESMTNRIAWLPYLGWMYNYTLISGANTILSGIDGATDGTAEERDFLKAQALTFRAHGYTRLLQIYGPRWADSNNGARLTIPLRLDTNTGDCPLSSMGTVLDRIYKDLDDAIALYESSKGRRTYKWEPNINVAEAIYTRAALLKNDYKKAQEMAAAARQGFSIMSAETYKQGFALENNEYLWNNEPSEAEVAYFAWGAWYTCNGPYPCIWGHGPGAINIDLYRQIPDGTGENVYKDLYLTPDKRVWRVVGGVRDEGVFWDNEYVDPINMNMNGRVQRFNNAIASTNQLMKPEVGADWPNANTPTSETEGTIVVPLGAQYKFWTFDGYGTTCYPYIRASELLLSEAEAAYMNGDESTARSLLNDLLSKRIEGYTVTKSGQELLDEIRIVRRIELWGEGHSWFDLKRWGLTLERRAWVAGDPTSGNIPSTWAVKFGPEEANGWRWAIPNGEYQYNHAISVGDTDKDAAQ